MAAHAGGQPAGSPVARTGGPGHRPASPHRGAWAGSTTWSSKSQCTVWKKLCHGVSATLHQRVKVQKSKRSRHKLLWLMKSSQRAHQQMQTNLCTASILCSPENSGMFFIDCFRLEASHGGPRTARQSFTNTKG